MKERSGRYGFHACVRVSAPYARVRIASTAATATISLTPPRRNTIQSAVPIATTCSATADTCIAHDDAPNSR